jgi:capsular exopolysaccharide synthesis family protein
LELRSGAPVLGLIPRIPRARFKSNTLLVTLSRPDSESADAFKALRVRLMHAVNHRPAGSVILVTSSLAGEGKTTVLANLGVVLAMTGKRVVIVAADLRRPRLQTYFPGSDFSRSSGAGLTEVLTDKRKALEALSTTGTENLLVLHVGGKANAASPSDLLGSARMTDLLAELRDLADIILVDTPPLLASSDVVILASLSDGVLFVVDPRLAHGSNIEQARHELDIIDVALIGIVVNRHDPRRFRTYGSGHGNYGEGHEQRSGEVAGESVQTERASTEQRTTSSAGDRDPGNVPIP